MTKSRDANAVSDKTNLKRIFDFIYTSRMNKARDDIRQYRLHRPGF